MAAQTHLHLHASTPTLARGRMPASWRTCARSRLQRFRPITIETPKALLPLLNVPMIEYTLEWLAMNHVEEVRGRWGPGPGGPAFIHHACMHTAPAPGTGGASCCRGRATHDIAIAACALAVHAPLQAGGAGGADARMRRSAAAAGLP